MTTTYCHQSPCVTTGESIYHNRHHQVMITLTNKHNTSLAAVMFMAHAIPIMVKHGLIQVDEEDASFIAKHIKVGKRLVYSCILSALLRSISTISESLVLLNILAQIILVIVITIIIVAIIAIIHDTPLLNEQNRINIPGLKNILSRHHA